jgi:molecular chaperone GrpE
MAFADKNHWDKIDKDWQNGITSIYQQLLSGLEKSGIEKINEIEIPFDPNIHQSISVVVTDDEKKDHTVEKVLQVGYRIGDRVIRPAKVTIYEYKKAS